MRIGGAWLISNSAGTILAQGYNPDFGYINSIHSHRSEKYGVLYTLLFIDTYIKHYAVTITNSIKYYGDNLEVVSKLQAIEENPNVFDSLLNTTDHEVARLLKYVIHPQMSFHHVRSHQDDRKNKDKMNL